MLKSWFTQKARGTERQEMYAQKKPVGSGGISSLPKQLQALFFHNCTNTPAGLI